MRTCLVSGQTPEEDAVLNAKRTAKTEKKYQAPGVVALAGEVIDAGIVRHVGDEQRANRADQELGRGSLLGIG